MKKYYADKISACKRQNWNLQARDFYKKENENLREYMYQTLKVISN